MRLLFVLEHFPPYLGGAETLFGGLTAELAARGHSVTVITTRFRADLPRRETWRGVEVRRIDCRNRYLFSLLALPAVWRAARRADLVHTTTYNAALPAWLGAKLAGKRVVITFHEYWGDLWLRLPFIPRWKALAFRAYERFVLLLKFNRYVAVSDFTARALVRGGVKEARVVRIHNGLDYRQIPRGKHRPDPGFNYAFFGRLGISKGLDLLLPAAAELKKTHPNARLRLIIPRRPRALYRQIVRMIDELGITDVVELHHELPRAELHKLLLSSSCVVIPSYSEGFCFAAAEAVGMGIPVISSGRGALTETVGGRHLTMAGMDAGSLAACLRSAAQGDFRQRPAPGFALEDSIQGYLGLYTDEPAK